MLIMMKTKVNTFSRQPLLRYFLPPADSWASCAGALCVGSCTWAGRTWCSVRTKVSASPRRRGRSFTFTYCFFLAISFLSSSYHYFCLICSYSSFAYCFIYFYMCITFRRLEINRSYIFSTS